MKNATMLYKVPGAHQTNGNVTFDYVIVDADVPGEIEKAEAAGWRKSLPEAQAFTGDFEGAPTREELEQKATELGLKFDGRTSDKRLAALIAEALAA